jgi:hypothetical protein
MLPLRQKYLPHSLLHWKNERDSQTDPLTYSRHFSALLGSLFIESNWTRRREM